MSEFYSSVIVHTGERSSATVRNEVVGVVRREMAARGFVELDTDDRPPRVVAVATRASPDGRWVSLAAPQMDDVMALADQGSADEIAIALSRIAPAVRLLWMDTYLVARLFRDGAMVDQYSSRPERTAWGHRRGVEEQARFRGAPERWRELLAAPQRHLAALREAWAPAGVTERDRWAPMEDTTNVFGWQPEMYRGAIDLEATDEQWRGSHLRFRLVGPEATSTQPPELAISPDGGEPSELACGRPFEREYLLFSYGAPARGLSFEVSGSALTDGVLEVERVAVSCDRFGRDANGAFAPGGESGRLVAQLPGAQLAARAPGARFRWFPHGAHPLRGVPFDWLQSYATVSVQGRARRPGTARLAIAVTTGAGTARPATAATATEVTVRE